MISFDTIGDNDFFNTIKKNVFFDTIGKNDFFDTIKTDDFFFLSKDDFFSSLENDFSIIKMIMMMFPDDNIFDQELEKPARPLDLGAAWQLPG